MPIMANSWLASNMTRGMGLHDRGRLSHYQYEYLVVANFANTKLCKKNFFKGLKPWYIANHMTVLSECFQMNTNVAGFR